MVVKEGCAGGAVIANVSQSRISKLRSKNPKADFHSGGSSFHKKGTLQ